MVVGANILEVFLAVRMVVGANILEVFLAVCMVVGANILEICSSLQNWLAVLNWGSHLAVLN